MKDIESKDSSPDLPVTAQGVEDFLASHWVQGIGSGYAHKIVDRFGTDSIEMLLRHPERLHEIKGIGEARIATAHDSLRAVKWDLNLLLFLFSCGISDTMIDRIIHKYRKRTKEVILSDPYSMVEDVWQLGFFTADKIGKDLDISPDDPRRLVGALVAAVKHYAEGGHLFATPEEAVGYAARIAKVASDKVRTEIGPAVDSGRLVESRGGLYLPVFYNAEKEAAAKLADLASTPLEKVKDEDIPEKSQLGHIYSEVQRRAIETALNSPVSAITGGPGSGKTTVVRAIVERMEMEGKKVILAAPTGRAAKRLSLLTGAKATTIHSLLGYRPGEGYHNKRIDADMLIIDEGSMMEQVLFNHLLQALRPGTRVLLVGDVDQLPAIGAGDVMRQMMDSGSLPVARLSENFRQAAGSGIASGAATINSGLLPYSDPDSDFMIIPEPDTAAIHERIMLLVAEEIPSRHGVAPTDLLVVTPQQIGPLGAKQLNIDLQQRINPEGPALRRGTTIMRLGDPVMQTANSRDRGVYNGEVGRITSLSEEEQKMEVTFTDGRKSQYLRNELSELTLAYATTVHKLQGSEARYIIIPVTLAHKPMLYRNLIYTAVSRATDLCILVGEKEALEYAIENTPASRRNSRFGDRLAEKMAQYRQDGT